MLGQRGKVVERARTMEEGRKDRLEYHGMTFEKGAVVLIVELSTRRRRPCGKYLTGYMLTGYACLVRLHDRLPQRHGKTGRSEPHSSDNLLSAAQHCGVACIGRSVVRCV